MKMTFLSNFRRTVKVAITRRNKDTTRLLRFGPYKIWATYARPYKKTNEYGARILFSHSGFENIKIIPCANNSFILEIEKKFRPPTRKQDLDEEWPGQKAEQDEYLEGIMNAKTKK